jgi:hypothetical protein
MVTCYQYDTKGNMFDPDLESVGLQELKFTGFFIGRVYFLLPIR